MIGLSAAGRAGTPDEVGTVGALLMGPDRPRRSHAQASAGSRLGFPYATNFDRVQSRKTGLVAGASAQIFAFFI
jgi:hypothetical protein